MGGDLASEEQFGPYLVYERLGVGGMATVHRAIERGAVGGEREVALKRLLPHLAEDASFIKAFVREAKLASLLTHDNIVQIYELGRVGTEYFISMEYIDGRDIRRILRHARKVTGPAPINVTVGVMQQLCDALDYAHTKLDEHGTPMLLVHRDVSPSNLLVTTAGQLKVIDFGIARAQSSQLRTQTGRVKGKLAYMAPEAISSSRDLDARSDVWACGVILHELLTARPLFASKNEYQTLIKVQRGDITPPSAFNPACPPELDAIVYRALARDPDDRFASALAMLEELQRVTNLYALQTSHREIAKWLEDAFSLALGETTSPRVSAQSNTPVLARNRDDEAAVEMVWGTGDGEAPQPSGPIVLDDVPDVSSKLRAVANPDDELDDVGDIPTPRPSHGTSPHGSDRAPTPDVAPNLELSRRDYPPAPKPGGLEPLRPPPRTRPGVQPASAAVSLRRPPVVTAKLVIGASMVERHRPSRRWPMVLGLVLLAGGGAGIAVYVTSTMHSAPAVTTPPLPPREAPAIVSFEVAPADAEVQIDGRAHKGSPWRTELVAGTHQIEIRRAGYTAYLTALELEPHDKHSLHIELRPLGTAGTAADATLAVTTTPSGLTAEIDGTALAQPTPFKLAVKPGRHTIVLKQAGAEVWRQTVTTEPASEYEFNPSFVHRAPTRTPTATVSDVVITDEAIVTPVAVDAGELLPIQPVLPTGPAPPTPPAPTGPVTVAPNAVTKLAGDPPDIAHDKSLPSVVAAKLCIDVAGAVTSVDMVGSIAKKLAADLGAALRTWRYAPYAQAGTPVAACFVVTLRLR